MKSKLIDPFQAIADPNRRQILFLLSTEKQSINAIASNFNMSRPAISKHIKILTEAGFISVKEKGRERYCTLHKKGFKAVQDWVTFFDKFWYSKLKNLEQLMNNRPKIS